MNIRLIIDISAKQCKTAVRIFYPFAFWSYAMRYIMLLTIVFSFLLSPASAQTELPKPTGLFVEKHGRDCIFIMWDEVAGAADYQIRLTRRGPGALQYSDKARKEDQLRGWRNWKELASTANGWAHDYGFRRSVLWCDLGRDQTIRARVRAVDAEGNTGAQIIKKIRTRK
ncbi:MAG: hypothetical protein OXN94_01830 [Chloroflexota bacterium]|nr:hypothetical protein [Chloroflexota bacterium]